MVNIKVAVRIRPLSRRESLSGDEVIVRKENKSVLVTNPKIPERQDGDSRQRTRKFAVDFCYDPSDPDGCSQEAVYKEIGSEVLHSMFEGYNACVLAYGHSASGKTYTIMGIQDDPGLTPRLCHGLFEKINGSSLKNGKIRVQVIVSFLEIYNEKVRDLLGTEETVASSGNFSLRVREHPKLGPYVQGLSEHLVSEKEKLLELLTTGSRRRSTAATENNIHSSRSHAVFTIQFKQCDGENFETEKSSKVHLVDLAGSLQEVSHQETHTKTDERASSSQSKERLKEGANINKSLVTLGNVVSALAENCETGSLIKAQSSAKSWHPFVPYRDSVLTWLLKDSLGGNSNTIMIATISPASSCLTETVNTLRYAKRTKRIVNQPIVNEDPKIRTIRQLRVEISRLKRLLLSFQSCGSWIEVEETDLEEATHLSIPESKWLDPGGTNVTNKEGRHSKSENERISLTQGEDNHENVNGIDDEKRKKFEDLVSSQTNDCEGGGLGQGAAYSEGNARKINDEKKSAVNGSVNDNFLHETQIFSDSLESFPPAFLKSGNVCEAVDDGSGRVGTTKDPCKLRETSAEKFSSNLMRDFSSDENLSRKKLSAMLHRNRPDLIKGISSRSKDGFPSGSSQSCTDVSNLSQTTSENSLNSSGSVEVPPLEKTPSNAQEVDKLISREAKPERRDSGGKKKGDSVQPSPSTEKKTEKRSEIVEAVTSRLYVTKKKTNHKELVAKQEVAEDGELEELKLCKRARMKLFDMSRKLALTRKMKKTVDNDTQTDNMTTTLRVKEKSVITEPRGISGFEEVGTPEENTKEEKSCVIMNQVFIPRGCRHVATSNYVVECEGKVVRIEAPETMGKHESATQTSSESRTCRNANTSPIEFSSRDEDCFSEDSLDLEDGSRNCGEIITGEHERLHPQQETSSGWPPNSQIYFFPDSEKRVRQKSKAWNINESKKSHEVFFNVWPLTVLSEETINQGENAGIPLSDACKNSSEEWTEENFSSENSFTSVEGTEDVSFSSETSSEDFVFYESPKDKDSSPKAKSRGNRELYTITENSEHSDPSDSFSPVRSQSFSLNSTREKGSSELDSPRDSRLWNRVETETKKELKMHEWPTELKEAEKRDEHSETNNGRMKNKIETKKSINESAGLYASFGQPSNSSKNISEVNLEVPKSTSLLTAGTTFKSSGQVPRFTGDSRTSNKTEINNSHPEIQRCRMRGAQMNSTRSDWTDFRPSSQKQYLNLNIPGYDGASASGFSVDTHLFERSSQKDQSADVIFNSADSITFVFMGPAKPKTSVLMELIKRSLGKIRSPEEAPFVQRTLRSRGVQCDTNLTRSVSVDSAMIALSKIAKNQDLCSNLQRAASLRALSPYETHTFLGREESNYQWDCEGKNADGEAKRSAVKYSVEIKKAGGAETPKKSVSWSGKAKREVNHLEREASDFDLNTQHLPELEAENSNDGNPARFSPQRRVRFLKPETRNPAEIETSLEQMTERDRMKAFLKEATQLLKNINYRYAKYQEFSAETFEKFAVEASQAAKENQRISRLKTVDLTTARSKAENCRGRATVRSRRDALMVETKSNSLTWPRMRAAAGKPPTGMKAKSPTSPFPSHFNSLNPNDFRDSDSTSISCQSSRMGSGGQCWKLSYLPLSHGDNRSKPPFRSQLSSCNESPKGKMIGDSDSFLLATSPRSNALKPNFDSVLKLQTDIEESCRRLEMTAERDQMRERISAGLQTDSGTEAEWFRRKVRLCCKTPVADAEKMEAREAMRRRKPEKCAGGCTCSASRADPCKHLWSKGCRSCFELDSFGPGSMHCHQLCMFCRKKDAEIYHSALSLNSECSSDLCRLNYYGFCPCSPVRLSHVTSSPRAYMQRLLALRRRIVSQTARNQLDARTPKALTGVAARSLNFLH